MDRKVLYTISLIGFFLVWEALGLAAIAPHRTLNSQPIAPPVKNTLVVPAAATDAAGIPETGKPEPLWGEVVLFYGLIGLTALFLIMALLSFANKSTAPYAQHKAPPDDTLKH